MAKGGTNAGGGSGKSEIIATAETGSTVTCYADRYLTGLKVYGKSVQNGVPSPDTPVEIKNVGDGGSLTETVEGDGLPTQTAKFTTGLPLCGIPVGNGGNVTIDGQQYIADTLEINADGSGKVVKRTNLVAFNGSEEWSTQYHSGQNIYRLVLTDFENTITHKPICNYLKGLSTLSYADSVEITNNTLYLRFDELDIFQDASVSKRYITNLHNTGNPLTILYAYKIPKEISLTAAEVQTFLALRTSQGGNSIINDAAAFQEVSYAVVTNRTAQEKNGVWCFRGCGVGEWTVEAKKDGKEAFRNVSITEADQRMRYYVDVPYCTAYIHVTYPVGSVCKCTKGGNVLAAVGTSGSYTFTVPEAGDWIVSCTDGTDTATKTVTITEDGQEESVSLEYGLHATDFDWDSYGVAGTDYEIVDDDGAEIPRELWDSEKNWNARLLTTNALIPTADGEIDVFLIGGGVAAGSTGSSSAYYGSGGKHVNDTVQVEAGTVYPVVIGDGGQSDGVTANNASVCYGGTTSGFGLTAETGENYKNASAAEAGEAVYPFGADGGNQTYGGCLTAVGSAPANTGTGTYNGKKVNKYKAGSGIVIIRNARGGAA